MTSSNPVSLPTTDANFCSWLAQASPDDAFEYHRGFLVLDVSPLGETLGARERRELVRVARRARWAADRQLVHLVQRRHAANDFSYLAIARPRPNPFSSSPSLLPLTNVAKCGAGKPPFHHTNNARQSE